MNHEKILIVDDNKDIRDILANTFRDYHLLFATNGEEALDVVAKNTPDLIILDIMMPLMNGYEFLEKIKADPVLRFLKVIIISAKALSEEQIKGIRLGALDYITKPFERDLLREKAARMISLHFYDEILEYQNMMMRYIQHHSRTGLNMISCATDLLAMGDEEVSEPVINCSTVIREGMTQILRLIEQCEWVTEIATRKKEFVEKVNLRQVIDANLDAMISMADDRKLNLTLPDEDEDFQVYGDEGMILRAICAVISHVAMRSDIDGDIKLEMSTQGHNYVIEVTGDKNSIPPEILPRIFNPFFFDENVVHAGFDGIDLSLPISGMIMRLYGGTASAYNTPDQKSATIKLVLPTLKKKEFFLRAVPETTQEKIPAVN